MASYEPSQDRNKATGDSGPGTGMKDLLPLPTDTQPVSDPSKKETSATMTDEPTLSHALAQDDHDEKGLAQQDHDHEVLDLGWNEKKQNILEPLVGGMDNEELWMLIRRFDKQMYHVKATPYPVPGSLDLNIADEEEFSPDKLRTAIERFYMTVIVGILATVKHIARLRSWRETRRTGAFAAAYFIAWAFDFIVPLLTATLIILITYPRSRELLFPPAPIALVDSKTGGIQKPKAGVLGSHDSATGAPENHKGEAVEQEASNFVNGIASVAVSSATGKHPQGDPDSAQNAPIDSAVPDPSALAAGAANLQTKAAGDNDVPRAKADKTKVPIETLMWSKMRPITHGIGDVTDTWERLANALSPTRPFPEETHRLRIATLILPVFGISLFVTSNMFMKGVTFGVGLGFFGDPVISRGLDWLNTTFPNWQKLLELRNTILKGVPTNAQLTITLLRIGEANNAPLPPPPRIGQAPPDKPAEISEKELRTAGSGPPFNATDAEIHEAIKSDPGSALTDTGDQDIDSARQAKHPKKDNKIINFFRGATRGLVKTAIGTDHVRAATTGSHAARDRLGAVPPEGETPISGPVEFKARYEGKKGHVYITKKATIPAIGFSNKETMEKIGLAEREHLHPMWSVAIADIVELKKIGGYGWKAKLVVGWAMNRELADGLEIVTRGGEKYKVTAMPLRDELFNRLIAMGGQKWEAW